MNDVQLPPNETVGPLGKWKVTKVADNVRDWSSQKGGKMKSYRIDLDGGPRSFERVELNQKEATAPPTVGTEYEGEVIKRHYEHDGEVKSDLQFKKAARAGGGGGGGRVWKPRPDDVPEVYAARQAGIIRQHSQHMAIRLLELAEGSVAQAEQLAADLGITTEDEAAKKSLVEAITFDVSAQAAAAWAREENKKFIGKRLAEVQGS